MRKTFMILSMMVLAFAIVSCDNAKDTDKENADEKQKVEQTESNDQGTVITDEAKDLDPKKVIDNAKVVESEPVEGEKKTDETTDNNEVKANSTTSGVINRSKVVTKEETDMTEAKKK